MIFLIIAQSAFVPACHLEMYIYVRVMLFLKAERVLLEWQFWIVEIYESHDIRAVSICLNSSKTPIK